MAHQYFITLPVYRLAPEAFEAERDARVTKVMAPWDKFPAVRAADRQRATEQTRQHDLDSYGLWILNEVVGQICLYFYGSQVRGEYYAVRKKRLVLTRTKVLQWLTWKLAPEQSLTHPMTNASILADIRTYVGDCKREVKLRHVDDSWLETVGPFVNWVELHGETNGFGRRFNP
jgi:hypothetical protein